MMTGETKARERGRGRLRAILGAAWLPAAALFLAAALCLLVGFSREPRLYSVDYGQYQRSLDACGLAWAAEDEALGDLQYARPVIAFRYTHFSWSNLLTPRAGGSLVYLVALVRLFTEPLGLPFSVNALALVCALLLSLSTAMLAQALRRLSPRIWYAPPLFLCALYTDGNFCAMFRGLYAEGPAVALCLLFVSVLLFAWSLPAARRAGWALPVVLCSFLAVKVFAPLAVFLPLALAVDAAFLLSCRGVWTNRKLLAAACALALLVGLRDTVRLAGEDPDYFSDASAYEAAFHALLPAAEDPVAVLREWGLDESYGSDVGRTYYDEESAYAHCPRRAEEAAVLFSHITPGRLIQTCLSRPALLRGAIRSMPAALEKGFENGRGRTLSPNAQGFSAVRTEGGLLSALWLFLPHSFDVFSALCGAGLVVCIALAIRQKRPRWLLGGLAFVSAAAYLPFSVALGGYAQCDQVVLFQVFLECALLLSLLCAALLLAPRASQWLHRYGREPYTLREATRPAVSATSGGAVLLGKAGRAVRRIAASRGRIMLLTGLAALLMLLGTFLPASRPVSVNNGDFGRMMAQLDLTWTGDMFFDAEGQMGHGAIEEYEYLRAFDPAKLTPLAPTYSLFWFASLVRLLTEPFGLPFSTWWLALLMGLTAAVCVLVLVRDLYGVLGKWTLAAAALLCAMLFSQTYLVWYDSLYGESCVLLGLLLTLMCAVHLCVMPREKSWKRGAWLGGLALALNVLVTAKAQMLMALPGALLLFLALAFYHRAYRYDLRAVQGAVAALVCAALALSAVGVYRSDRTSDSVSQKHTMWQAYFYGIFMISDDPVGDMEELGVDTAMAADIGKYVDFSDDARYVYAPLSPEAQAGFYDHVSMGTILQWYLTHPAKLWQMLDHAAGEAKELYASFRVYRGQDYGDPGHDAVDGLNLWPGWRGSLTPGSFLGYVVLYGALLVWLLRALLRRNGRAEKKILCVLPLFLLLTGALQFPLSVLGNGFADNQKQLFCFSLCHDLLLGGALLGIARYLAHKAGPLPLPWRKNRETILER